MLQVGIQRLYSSPLQRCLETAQIAGEAARLESILDNRLIEWQPGEDSVTVQTRMVEALESALQNHLPTSSANSVSIGLISHGGPIGVLLEWLGMKPAELDAYRIYDHKNPLPPAAVWQASRVDQANPWVMGLDFLPDVTLA
jgi:broad specificity phosphatase PhoE